MGVRTTKVDEKKDICDKNVTPEGLSTNVKSGVDT